MAERLTELFHFLVGCEIPEEEVEKFVIDLARTSHEGQKRCYKFLRAHRDQITARANAMQSKVNNDTPVKGLFT